MKLELRLAIVAAIITALALSFISGLYRTAYLYCQSRNWERVTCYITKSTTERVEQTWPNRAYYTPKIEFQYVYGERDYLSRQFKLDGLPTKYDGKGKWLVQVFPEGALVDGYVNPKNPAEAVLLRDSPKLFPLLIFATLLPLLLWGAAGCLVLARKKGITHIAARVSIILWDISFLTCFSSFLWMNFVETSRRDIYKNGIPALLATGFAIYLSYRFARFYFGIKKDEPKVES